MEQKTTLRSPPPHHPPPPPPHLLLLLHGCILSAGQFSGLPTRTSPNLLSRGAGLNQGAFVFFTLLCWFVWAALEAAPRRLHARASPQRVQPLPIEISTRGESLRRGRFSQGGNTFEFAFPGQFPFTGIMGLNDLLPGTSIRAPLEATVLRPRTAALTAF